MTGSTYHADGKGHWLLEQLVAGAARRDELLDAAEAAGHRKIKYVIAAMQTDGFIIGGGYGYAISDAGVAALDRLRSGREVSGPSADAQPNVRIFDRQVVA